MILCGKIILLIKCETIKISGIHGKKEMKNNKIKAVYTTTPAASGWAGALILFRYTSREDFNSVTDGRTDRQSY